MNCWGVIKQQEYNVGDKVKIVDCNDLRKCELVNPSGKMEKWAGKVMTIADIDYDNSYIMQEDNRNWFWYPEMIYGKMIKINIKGELLNGK